MRKKLVDKAEQAGHTPKRARTKKKSLAPPIHARRPHTRAWTKANLSLAPEPISTPSPLKKRTQRELPTRKRSRSASPDTPNKRICCEPPKAVRGLSKPAPLLKQSLHKLAKSLSDDHSQRISTWLTKVSPDPVLPKQNGAQDSPEPLDSDTTSFLIPCSEDRMTTTCSHSVVDINGEPAAAPGANPKHTLTNAKLSNRAVGLQASRDVKQSEINAMIMIKPPSKTMNELLELRQIAQNFSNAFDTHASSDCSAIIEEFQVKFYASLDRIDRPIVSATHFEAQARRCDTRNEAVLQRTVMMSLFNAYHFPEELDWTAEAVWTIPTETRLPSLLPDLVTAPKPDLCISFTESAFPAPRAGDRFDGMPPELRSTIFPDCGPEGGRYFPFLFVEVKCADTSLKAAHRSNLLTASQALYNMWSWVETGDQVDAFFKDVRVFSFAMNADKFDVRMHRAEMGSNGSLKYSFCELFASRNYSRDAPCMIFKSLLNKYARKELLPILRKAYDEAHCPDQGGPLNLIKRKRSIVYSESSKRSARSGTASISMRG